jgi:ABC-type methionine transport system ATPase subunit
VLSGGEKQRVSIARCLAQDAAVLLLDEPGAFLDSKARHDVISILEQLNRDSALTVVLVTHQPDEIESEGWRILTLSGGVIEEAS